MDMIAESYGASLTLQCGRISMLVLDTTQYGMNLHPLLVDIVDKGGLFGKEFWAAILGAIVGGIIGIVGQILAFRYQDRVRKAEVDASQEALGRMLLMKLLKMQAAGGNTRDFIRLQLDAGKQLVNAEPWAVVRPITNVVESVSFSPGEVVLVASFDSPELMKELFGLDDTYNTLSNVMKLYEQKRNILMERIPKNAFDGKTGTSVLTPALALELKPTMAELNGLVEQGVFLSEMIFGRATKSTELLLAKLNQRFGSNMNLVPLIRTTDADGV